LLKHIVKSGGGGNSGQKEKKKEHPKAVERSKKKKGGGQSITKVTKPTQTRKEESRGLQKKIGRKGVPGKRKGFPGVNGKRSIL